MVRRQKLFAPCGPAEGDARPQARTELARRVRGLFAVGAVRERPRGRPRVAPSCPGPRRALRRCTGSARHRGS
jgi:hypothetical protein